MNDGLDPNGTQIVITVNGPGEIACWLYPLATMLKRELPHARICVAVVPCVFSSGTEVEVIKRMPYVDAACSIAETMSYIWRNKLPAGFRRGGPGFVLHLGGDSLFTLLLSRRLGVAAHAYVERPLAFQFLFDRVYYSGFENISGLKEKESVLGEMMVDAAHLRCPDRSAASTGRPTVGLYPSSRDYMAKYLMPFYAAAAEQVSQTMPDVNWVASISDFLDPAFLRNVPSVDDGRQLDGVNLTWFEEDGREYLKTPKGLTIELCTPSEVSARARLALTIPGSSTAELATLGMPMIMTLPTYNLDVVPLPGLAGHVGRIPLVGKHLKAFLADQILKRMTFYTHPNRRAKRMVVPEMVGPISAADVAAKIISMLQADTRPMEDELRAIMGPPGATAKLVSELAGYLQDAERSHDIATAH